jgi:hypothetical protein
MASFARWYVSKLHSYPWTVNLGSALVLMTAGDVLAQELEVHGMDKTTSSSSSNKEQELDRHPQHIHVRRYGTLGPDLESDSHSHSRQNTDNTKPEFKFFTATPTPAIGSSSPSSSSTTVSSVSVWDAIRDEFWFWNPFRTATMAAWSVGAYTPFYIGIYHLYEKYLPKQTMVGIGARVTLSFILSGPINAAFYVYGTAVHHTTEWWLLEVPLNINFEWDQLWAKALLKLETELPQTMIASGSCWIPINLFTFTYVPPHLRPLSLMFFSIFWNCYLSLSQHKDLVLPNPQELQM